MRTSPDIVNEALTTTSWQTTAADGVVREVACAAVEAVDCVTVHDGAGLSTAVCRVVVVGVIGLDDVVADGGFVDEEVDAVAR